MEDLFKRIKGDVTVISINYNIGLKKEILALKKLLSAQFLGNSSYQISYKIKNSFKNSNFLFYNSSIFNIPLAIILIFFRKKIFYCYHEPYYTNDELEFWGNKKIKNIGVNYIHGIMYKLLHNPIVFSNYAQLKLYAGFGRKKITYKLPLPNLLKSQQNKIFPIKAQNDRNILFVGAITKFKNPYHFIENSQAFFTLNTQYRLKIFSRSKFDSNYERSYIDTEIKQNISDEEINEKIKNCYIMLLCHDFCTQSGVLPLALALGKPVLIMNSRNYKYEPLIDKFCGRIINFSEDEIHMAIKDIDENYNEYSTNANLYYNRHLNILNYEQST